MKKTSILFGAALGFALLFTGCDTDNSSARVQEKSAVYATLKPWEKSYIDKGVVATGFTPDMVYMSVGHPSSVQPMESPEGNGELWTYKNFYPSVEAGKMRYSLSTEEGALGYTGGALTPKTSAASTATRNGGPSLGTTGGPQGGSLEPADMQSFTFVVLFRDGKVAKIAMQPN